MYVRTFKFTSTPEHRSKIEAMADEIYPFTRSLNGFLSATYTVSEDETEYGSISMWQTKADAEAAGAEIRQRVMPKLEGIATTMPQISVLEVYEPKT